MEVPPRLLFLSNRDVLLFQQSQLRYLVQGLGDKWLVAFYEILVSFEQLEFPEFEYDNRQPKGQMQPI